MILVLSGFIFLMMDFRDLFRRSQDEDRKVSWMILLFRLFYERWTQSNDDWWLEKIHGAYATWLEERPKFRTRPKSIFVSENPEET